MEIIAPVRRPWVSINHRTAALLSSHFDVLFALNHTPNPGEKRLLEAASALSCIPPSFAEQVDHLLIAAASAAPANLDSLLGALCDGLDDCVRRST
jgi:hypothetical protein